jgi:hypothetical protein
MMRPGFGQSGAQRPYTAHSRQSGGRGQGAGGLALLLLTTSDQPGSVPLLQPVAPPQRIVTVVEWGSRRSKMAGGAPAEERQLFAQEAQNNALVCTPCPA